MDTIFQPFADAFEERLAAQPQVFYWKGETFDCIFNRVKRTAEAIEGGQWPEYTASLICRRNDFVILPQTNLDSLYCDNEWFGVAGVDSSDGVPIVTIHLRNGSAPR